MALMQGSLSAGYERQRRFLIHQSDLYFIPAHANIFSASFKGWSIPHLKAEAISSVDLLLIKEVTLRVIRFEVECVLFVILCTDSHAVIPAITFETVLLPELFNR